jgi:hypothetical protein
LEEKVEQLKDVIASRKEEWTQEHKLMDDNKEELADDHAHKKEITPDCDWILNSFVARAEKRDAEKEGLTAAKEFLAGAAPPSMLQSARVPNFNDDAFPKISFRGVSFLQRNQ